MATTTNPTTRSRRPRNREDRDACLSATASIETAPDLHPIVRAIAQTAYVAARDAYVQACAANDQAAAAVTVARRERVSAEARFDVAFRLWSASVVDAQAKSLARELGAAFGVLPGDLLRKTTRTKLVALRRTLPLLEGSARLGGDPRRLEALRGAIQPLSLAVAAFESAIRKRRGAVLRFEAAVCQFDRVYGTLAAAMITYDTPASGTAAKVPGFRRAARRAGRVPDDPVDDAGRLALPAVDAGACEVPAAAVAIAPVAPVAPSPALPPLPPLPPPVSPVAVAGAAADPAGPADRGGAPPAEPGGSPDPTHPPTASS